MYVFILPVLVLPSFSFLGLKIMEANATWRPNTKPSHAGGIYTRIPIKLIRK